MGTRGPLPKRDEARAGHRTKAEKADKVKPPTDEPTIAPAADERWHAEALAFYASLKRSGMARFYEPSDWRLAIMRCRIQDVIERELDKGDLPAAALLGELSKIDARLGVTESDRRRMRVEVERTEGPEAPAATDDAVDAIMERYRGVAGSG